MDMKEASSSGPGKKGAGGKKNSHGAESDEREVGFCTEHKCKNVLCNEIFRASFEMEDDLKVVPLVDVDERSDICTKANVAQDSFLKLLRTFRAAHRSFRGRDCRASYGHENRGSFKYMSNSLRVFESRRNNCSDAEDVDRCKMGTRLISSLAVHPPTCRWKLFHPIG